ncbi:MAG TPA: hypothetical protein VGT61_07645 [Thermomicrobiales bacterium]|jgi:predicted SAM-dependent methyltransferase|nr:hypothetical protein [Thermomicrobiales bacterium]
MGDTACRRIIIGASTQSWSGWRQTQQDELNLVRTADWRRLTPPASLAAVLMEHVWEHLELAEAKVAARNLFDALTPGGYVRCAVPDGLFPDETYQRTVQLGGPGPPDHPAATHRLVYTWRTLPPVLEAAWFEVCLLEWWGDDGRSHPEPWDEQAGFIY